MGLAKLKTLENDLNKLETSRANAKTALKTARKRKGDLEDLIKTFTGICNDRVSDVNDHLTKMKNNYDDALSNIKSVYNLKIETVKEEGIYDDQDTNTALSYLEKELGEAETNVGTLEATIRTKETDIQNCKNSIRTEQRNIAVDARTKYNNAKTKAERREAAYKADPTNTKLKQEYEKARKEYDAAKKEYNKYKKWL